MSDSPDASTRSDAGSRHARGARRRRRRPSGLMVLGLVLLLGGLGCLGWVGYQYLGTNIVSQHAFDAGREDLRSRWQQAEPAEPSASPEQAVLPGKATALLRIPAFGADYEIPVLEGTDLDTLTDGVGHYAGTARPGQVGNFALAGHRVTHGQPFARLLELKRGDEVVVETRKAVYTYVLDESPSSLTVDDAATWVLDPVPGEPNTQPTRALITLTTCQDLFSSPDRSVGFGHLRSTRNK